MPHTLSIRPPKLNIVTLHELLRLFRIIDAERWSRGAKMAVTANQTGFHSFGPGSLCAASAICRREWRGAM
jgi:hypothetical protein